MTDQAHAPHGPPMAKSSSAGSAETRSWIVTLAARSTNGTALARIEHKSMRSQVCSIFSTSGPRPMWTRKAMKATSPVTLISTAMSAIFPCLRRTDPRQCSRFRTRRSRWH